ncbi:unnamed protein product [Paramecium pentaurelia]|uniref:Uncharacterized protein n=1 Tax=Paramecium pentaurelia TaxID=43138 RepID=A0A8S1VNP9_9CILI|nr:unnamed protein product [Paramecium pentaurelia]
MIVHNQLSSSFILNEDEISNTSIDLQQEMQDSVQLENRDNFNIQFNRQSIMYDSTELCDTINKQLIEEEQKQLLLNQITELRMNNQQLVEEIKDLHIAAVEHNEHLQLKNTEIAELKLVIHEQKQQNRKADDTIQQLKQQIQDFEYNIFEKDETIVEMGEQIKKIEMKKQKLELSLKESRNHVAVQKQQINSLLLNCNQINIDEIKTEIDNEQNKHLQSEIQLLQESYDQLLKEQEDSELKENQKLDQLKKDQLQYQHNLVELELLKLNLNQNAQEILQYDELIKKNEITIKYLEDTIQTQNDKYAQLQKKFYKSKLVVNELKHKIQDLMLLQQNDKAIILQQQTQINQTKKDLGKFRYQRDSLIEVQSKLLKSQYMEEEIPIKKQLDIKLNEMQQLQNELNLKKDELTQEQQLHFKSQQQILEMKTNQSTLEQKQIRLEEEQSSLNMIINQQEKQIQEYIQQIQDIKNQNQELHLRMSQFDKQTSQIITQFNQEIQNLIFNYHSYEQSYKDLEKLNIELNGQLNGQNELMLKFQKLSEENNEQKILITELQEKLLQLNKRQVREQFQQTYLTTKSISVQTDPIIDKQVIQNEEDKLRDVENTINFIINNLDTMKEKINLNQTNINELLSFKQIISNLILKQQGVIQENEQCYESTQIHTPRSIEKKDNKEIEQLNQQIHSLELQQIEKVSMINELQLQLQKQEQKIENLKLKETEKHLLDIIVSDRQQLCECKLQQEYNKYVSDTQNFDRIKQLESLNLQLKIKLEAQQEIAKENLRLRKKIATLENQDMRQSSTSPQKMFGSKMTFKTFQTNSTQKSIEKKRSHITDQHYHSNQNSLKQQLIESDTIQSKRYVEILKKCIEEQQMKLQQREDLMKQSQVLLNNLSTDLKKKLNLINSEDLTKKKQVITFIEKVQLQVDFVMKRLLQLKNTDCVSPTRLGKD